MIAMKVNERGKRQEPTGSGYEDGRKGRTCGILWHMHSGMNRQVAGYADGDNHKCMMITDMKCVECMHESEQAT